MELSYDVRNADDILKRAVWSKGFPIPGYNSSEWRADVCGHPMNYSEFGNVSSKYGWEIDHIMPVSRGGSNELSNLQPLYWDNNRRKGDTYPWNCENAV